MNANIINNTTMAMPVMKMLKVCLIIKNKILKNNITSTQSKKKANKPFKVNNTPIKLL